VRRRERDAQPPPNQHHHHLGLAALGEIFRMAGKRMPASLIHALLDWRGDHRLVFRPEAAGDGAVEERQHVAAVRRVQVSSLAGLRERQVRNFRNAGKEAAVADDDDARGEVCVVKPLADSPVQFQPARLKLRYYGGFTAITGREAIVPPAAARR